MTTAAVSPGRLFHGSVDPAKNDWQPFEWEEPALGRTDAQGEVAVFRPSGTRGNLTSGLWRYHAGAPGANADGSGRIVWSSPLGDECAVVLDGSAVITVEEGGKQHEVGPGSIVYQPKGLRLSWEIKGPYFKKFWTTWDGTEASGVKHDDVTIANISDNPADWTQNDFTEPLEGDLTKGEYVVFFAEGTTGTLMSGLWRTGIGLPGCEADGSLTTPYTGVRGDETILMLEGEAHLRNDETGEEWNFRAGDLIAIPSGVHVTWTSKGPFHKKFWVISNDILPA
jgi:uncharacterized cupin superfamily protein